MEGLFERGVEEFNGQFFFESHDTWEELWRETTGSNRLFYQGLIQTAVGFYHLSNANYKGAYSQFGKALAKIEQYVPRYHGIETELLAQRVQEFAIVAERLLNGDSIPFDKSRIPLIQWSGKEE
jgi:predicted metal-dependent hydrolase